MASIGIHLLAIGSFAWLGARWFARPDRLTDIVGSTLLELGPAADVQAVIPADAVQIVPPAPTPVQIALPEAPPLDIPDALEDSIAPSPSPAPSPSVPDPKASSTEAPTSSVRDEVFGKHQVAFAPSTVLISKPLPAPPSPTPPAPPRAEPVATFAGVQASPARRIVYLIDASGAMTSSLRFVKEELARSVARLSADQQFQVVVYRQPFTDSIEASGPGVSAVEYFHAPKGQPEMTQAQRQTKLDLVPWLMRIQPSGKADPLAGLQAAMGLSPDIVFVLTRSIKRSAGFDAGAYAAQVMSSLDVMNPKGILGKRATVIKTIQFLDEDPTGLMQAIAEEHGDGKGSYRVIGRSDVSTNARDGSRDVLLTPTSPPTPPAPQAADAGGQ